MRHRIPCCKDAGRDVRRGATVSNDCALFAGLESPGIAEVHRQIQYF
ncbi:hypothetical protein RSPO_c00785 [Ralstonia solanacearum Po82]|uniref:Uncharacterized protein n=1 Tax=Ralstonia solanacearum (strain Po82) TaxID=1031711 RepID=F6FYK2_RALS8|nr:hypothetical protein RSPO_c00785 [Ralstonia solanacearum Po82]